jgi:hypothetical protein
MKYCCSNNQRTGSCYFELQKGKFSDKWWLDDSLYLSADTFDSLSLHQLFTTAVPEFYYYGITEIDKEKWELIKLTADKIGGEVKIVIDEICAWTALFSPGESVVTILGI